MQHKATNKLELKKSQIASGFKWTSALVEQLLELRLHRKEESDFGDTEWNMWKKISHILSETAGLTIKPVVCIVKFRRLLTTYRIHKRKQLLYGLKSKWEYFKDIDKVYGSEFNDPEKQDFSQVLNNVRKSPDIYELLACHATSDILKEKKTKTPQCITKNDLWKYYTQEKSKQNNSKDRFTENMWMEDEKLKQSQEKALLTLTKAMNSSASH